MIKKPNSKYRFCLDFRKLNSASKKDVYPLHEFDPRQGTFREVYFHNRPQAYFQVLLEKSSREFTAFTVPGRSLFHFTRMPYGLKSAPATFQRLLDRLIKSEMEPHAFVYLDDIVVVTPTFEEHLEWLGRVFARIKEAVD